MVPDDGVHRLTADPYANLNSTGVTWTPILGPPAYLKWKIVPGAGKFPGQRDFYDADLMRKINDPDDDSAWLYSQEWWRRELWKSAAPPGTTLEQYIKAFPSRFPGSNDANNLILQVRTWERHDVGGTPGFGGDVEKALRSIKVPFLYMPSETDLYFPLTDANYERQFMSTVVFAPIRSLWGHPAGAGASPEDRTFLNQTISKFLAGERISSP
jgi:hypothetical protein